MSGRIPRRSSLDARVEVRPSRIEGLGLFAREAIREGEVVATLGGRLIDDAELRRVAQSGRKYNSAAVGEGINLLLADDEPITRGNHSCDPNLWLANAITLVARRDIAPGEEITSDYATQTAVEWEMVCRCGSAGCRRIIRGSDWQLPDLQRRYDGHFAPFLNARIAAARLGR